MQSKRTPKKSESCIATVATTNHTAARCHGSARKFLMKNEASSSEPVGEGDAACTRTGSDGPDIERFETDTPK
jgi:hypothetical protein